MIPVSEASDSEVTEIATMEAPILEPEPLPEPLPEPENVTTVPDLPLMTEP